MPFDTIDITLAEKPFYRYCYFSDSDQLHIMMPIASGDTIGLDNTCQSALSLKEFFGLINPSNNKATPLSIFDELAIIRDDLNNDIKKLKWLFANIHIHLENCVLRPNKLINTTVIIKDKRLKQVKNYSEALNLIRQYSHPNARKTLVSSKLNQQYPEYFTGIEKLLARDHNNAHSILLRPNNCRMHSKKTQICYATKIVSSTF